MLSAAPTFVNFFFKKPVPILQAEQPLNPGQRPLPLARKTLASNRCQLFLPLFGLFLGDTTEQLQRLA